MDAQKTREAKGGKGGIQLFKTFLCLLDKTSRQLARVLRDLRGGVELMLFRQKQTLLFSTGLFLQTCHRDH